MKFNTHEFLFLFLPITLVVFWQLARKPRLALAWLVAASFVFYAWDSPYFLLLMVGSIVGNYLFSRGFDLLPDAGGSRKALLTAGVVTNLLLLAGFKYTGFALRSWNDLTGFDVAVPAIILPLGISFYTFEQISYLVDRYRRQIPAHPFVQYCLYVTFFAELVAGPIVRPQVIMPQLSDPDTFCFRRRNIEMGLAIFFIGLMKKCAVADELALHVGPAFRAADAGLPVSCLEAWTASLAYMFQLYYDFSGYSDMAIGLGRLFGIRLSVNFDSPYKATSIIDFWRRWHITLSTFLRDYVYISLGGSRKGTFRRHANLMLTMLLGGLWHGAGWTFIVWGGMHGAFLVVNHLWNGMLGIKAGQPVETTWYRRAAARTLTLLAVLASWVVFRAATLEGAGSMLLSMTGVHGLELPVSWRHGGENVLGVMALLERLGVEFHRLPYYKGPSVLLILPAVIAITLLAPNCREIFRLDLTKAEEEAEIAAETRHPWWVWQPTPLHGFTCGIVSVVAILYLVRPSTFLYFDF